MTDVWSTDEEYGDVLLNAVNLWIEINAKILPNKSHRKTH